MDVKIVKESVDYGFNFDIELSSKRLEKIEDAVYALEEVCDIEYRGEGFGVIIEGEYDSPELLDKIKRLIQGV